MGQNCQKCGADLGPGFDWARMANCAHCGTSHILRDKVFEAAGEAGVLHEGQSLVHLGRALLTAHGSFTPAGVVRFSYGRGTWDEFWCPDTQGGAWISVDEGDIALQHAVKGAGLPEVPPTLGVRLRALDRVWLVSEAETARCVGFRGQLPEIFALDQSFTFINATGADGRILSGEFGPDGAHWFEGPWLDPFDLRAA